MKHTPKAISIVSLLIALTACKESFDLDIFDKGRTISFATELVQTRANPYTEGGTNDFTTMGVYTTISDEDFDENTYIFLMDNTRLQRTNGSSGWHYSPASSWEGTNKHSFFAYAPHNAIGLTNYAEYGVPAMTFTVQNTAKNQVDLLVAEARYNLQDTLTGAVHLKMRHALTRVVFSARLANTTAAGEQIKITKIVLNNINSTAEREMDFTPSYLWKSHSEPTSYTLSNDGIELTSAPLTQTLQQITLAEGNLYLLPQNFSSISTATLAVTYETTGGSTPGTQTITTKMANILDEWLQGEAIRYILTIPNAPQPGSFTVGVAHEPWDNVDINAGISADPYLDITNINVSTYDAAATRIYYYTNIAANEVSLDPIGKIGSNNGSPFNIKEEFYAITSNDADGSFNFHPPVNGMGYIDLINRKTSQAGDRENNGKYKLILKLRAGKLIRDITIQPIVTTEAAKLNATPYVGTFHRWDEMGERIVTWHTDKAWNATIVNENSNHTELSIDRLVSPDFANNILYSYSPREAEGTRVDPSFTSVQGKGRIYFRVGWKSKTTNRTTNRYARILVQVEGEADRYIYCRQGEQEETITTFTSILFAVYNTAQLHTLALFPSQVGMLYQWNRTKVWDPLALASPPGFPASFETSFSHERNACPEGYLYPNQQALNEMKLILDNKLLRWGYYADGFFDRRAISTDHRVNASTLDVASAGFLFFPPPGNAPRSIFLTTGGDRTSNGELVNPGLQGGYWSDASSTTDNSKAEIGYFKNNGAGDYTGTSVNTPHEKDHAHSLRCMRPAPGTAWIVRFDANGGENAPLTLTVPTSAGSVTIPTTLPNNYWREGYDFKGWNTNQTGTGSTHQPGASFSPTATNPTVTTLYAQWSKDPYLKTDFRTHMDATQRNTYLLSAEGSYNGYNRSNIAGGTNGIVNSSYINMIAQEKAYPYLKWSDPYTTPKTWTQAYDNCKGLTDDGGGWRLPRASEVYLVSAASPISSLKELIKELLWTGSNHTLETSTVIPKAYLIFNWGSFTGHPLTESVAYRCVKEMTP